MSAPAQRQAGDARLPTPKLCSSSDGELVLKSLERDARATLSALSGGPPLVRAGIRRVIGPAEHYLVALQLLRWRDYVVENRHAVEELLFGRLTAVRPPAGFQFEGWFFVGDGRHPAGRIDQTIAGGGTTVVREVSDTEVNQFLATQPPPEEAVAEDLEVAGVSIEMIQLGAALDRHFAAPLASPGREQEASRDVRMPAPLATLNFSLR
jgi:hypothetical protein